MSATRPWTSSPIEIRSPIRIGWRIAISTPATKLAITVWAAKPMISPSTAVEASSAVAKRLTSVNWLSASAAPMSDDRDEDQPADQAQPGARLARELRGLHAFGRPLRPPEQEAVDDDGEDDRADAS